MEDELLYTQEDIDEWMRTCEELREKIKEQEDEICKYKTKIENGTLVEVVKCKDCKYYKEQHYEEKDEKPYIKKVCQLLKVQMQPDCFCCLAELKELQSKE